MQFEDVCRSLAFSLPLPCLLAAVDREDSPRPMSDTEDVKLPVPSRPTGVYGGARVGGLLSERGTTGGGVRGAAAAAAAPGGPRSSRKVVDGLRSASSRRLYSSFASNGSSKLMNGENTDGSTAGVTGGGRVGGTGSKSCSACGVQFTWRMRRHHCRGCKKVTSSSLCCVCAFGWCFLTPAALLSVVVVATPARGAVGFDSDGVCCLLLWSRRRRKWRQEQSYLFFQIC